MLDKDKKELKDGIISIFERFNVFDHTIGDLRNDILKYIDSIQEEPVSEYFEEALTKEWKGYNDRGAATVDALEDNTQELAFAKGFYRGSKWKAEQFEKERLKLCNTLTKEQAQIESDFVVNFIKNNNCTPTFIDAIEYGKKLKLKDEK